MVCPKCGSTLESIATNNLTVTACPVCRGILCPANSIGLCIRLAKESGLEFTAKTVKPETENRGWICEDSPSIDRSQPTQKTTETQTGSESRCPSCKTALTPFMYDPESQIALSECKGCRMVWIDSDKLDALINHFSQFQAKPLNSTMQPEPQNQHSQVIDSEQAFKQEQQTMEAYFRNAKPAFEDTVEIPIIRRILGIPCVERNLSMTPWATITIMAINIFLFMMVVLSPADADNFYTNLGFMPSRITSEPLTALFTFFTSMFMHAGFGHIFSNMMFLWLFGGRIEEDYGTKTFVAVYMIAGIVAGLSHTIASLGSTIPSIGASGAISGILGAFFVLHPKNRVITYFMLIPIPMSAALFLGFWFTMQIVNSMLAASAGGAGIAWFAHIGGFIAGA
ncbi:MAG: rhomboid family intramembrane serine protease, partial [Rubrobacteridae bacterium]|nr:rhomboid family intramembrane serine protease [Rubrobacteridae bacterium]